jgi:hypothetical protein
MECTDPRIFTFFDLETTDKWPRTSKITQIGATIVMEDCEGKTLLNNYESFVKTSDSISKGSSELTHIYKQTLAAAEPTSQAIITFMNHLEKVSKAFNYIKSSQYPKKQILDKFNNIIQNIDIKKEEKILDDLYKNRKQTNNFDFQVATQKKIFKDKSYLLTIPLNSIESQIHVLLQESVQESKLLPMILVAYNGNIFDFPILYREMHRWGLTPSILLKKCNITYLLDPMMWAKYNIDQKSLTIFSEKNNRSFKLGHVHESLIGHKFENAHQALADTMGLRNICFHQGFSQMEIRNICGKHNYCRSLDTFCNNLNIVVLSDDNINKKKTKEKIYEIKKRKIFFPQIVKKRVKK